MKPKTHGYPASSFTGGVQAPRSQMNGLTNQPSRNPRVQLEVLYNISSNRDMPWSLPTSPYQQAARSKPQSTTAVAGITATAGHWTWHFMCLLSHTLLPPAFEIFRLPTHGRAGRLLPFNRPTLLPRPCFQSTPWHLSCLQLVRTMFDPHTCHPLRCTIAVSRSPNGTFISFFPQHSSTSGDGPPDQLVIPHPTQQAGNDGDAACVFEYNEEVARNRKLETRRPGVHEGTRAGPVTRCGQFCTSFSHVIFTIGFSAQPHDTSTPGPVSRNWFRYGSAVDTAGPQTPQKSISTMCRGLFDASAPDALLPHPKSFYSA